MEKIKAFFNHYFVLVSIYFILALMLILFSVIFLDDIKAPSNILIYNIFGTLAILGYWESYQLGKKKLRLALSVGITRKQAFAKYIFRLLLSLGLSILLVGYYILIFKLYVNQYFDYSKVIFLPLVTVILSLLGFLEGLLHFKFVGVMIILGLISFGLIAIIIFVSIPFYFDIILLGIALVLAFINRSLVNKIRM
ncbi:MAG: hypothetical protein AB7V00_04610 [Bacilli bacterium]